MKAGEKNYLKESNGTKANCNANVTQVLKVTHLHKSWVLEDKPIRKAYQSIMYKNEQFHFIIINP